MRNVQEIAVKLTEFFQCDIISFATKERSIYLATKTRGSYSACCGEINAFLANNPQLQLIDDEMPKIKEHVKDWKCTTYRQYPLPRGSAIFRTQYNTNTGQATNAGDIIADEKGIAYHDAATVRDWVAKYPPNPEASRQEYYNDCANELGPVLPKTFSAVVKENYVVKKSNGKRTWVPKLFVQK